MVGDPETVADAVRVTVGAGYDVMVALLYDHQITSSWKGKQYDPSAHWVEAFLAWHVNSSSTTPRSSAHAGNSCVIAIHTVQYYEVAHHSSSLRIYTVGLNHRRSSLE